MRAGKLDRRVRIERDGPPVHDGLQNVAAPPEVLADRAASMRAIGGREQFANGENVATAPVIFRLRWEPRLDPNAATGVRPGDRIRSPARDDGQLFDIKSAIEIGRRDGIEIAAVRRSS